MSELTDLQYRFKLPGVLRIEAGQGGLTRLAISTSDAEAHLYLHGAHVTHFHPRGQAPALFMSRESKFEAGKAIRGGVPVIFPWFGPSATNPKAPAHGFARTRPWNLQDVTQQPDGSVVVTLGLGPDDFSRQWWTPEFELFCRVHVAKSLEISLEVRNASAAPFTFEEALHTYLAVADVREATLDGLAGREYLDKVLGFKRSRQGDGPMRFEGETDRMYLNTADKALVTDVAGRRTLSVDKDGSRTTVVWNPWIDRAKAFADFGDDEWPQMLCIETANAGENAVTLAPGARHVMKAVIESAAL